MKADGRYKEFRSELEWWLWAIQSPGKRFVEGRCRSSFVRLSIIEGDRNEGFVVRATDSSPFDRVWPLVTVEDEHGPIAPPEPERSPLEVAGGLYARDYDKHFAPGFVQSYEAFKTGAEWLVDSEQKVWHAGGPEWRSKERWDGFEDGVRAVRAELRRLIGRPS